MLPLNLLDSVFNSAKRPMIASELAQVFLCLFFPPLSCAVQDLPQPQPPPLPSFPGPLPIRLAGTNPCGAMPSGGGPIILKNKFLHNKISMLGPEGPKFPQPPTPLPLPHPPKPSLFLVSQWPFFCPRPLADLADDV